MFKQGSAGKSKISVILQQLGIIIKEKGIFIKHETDQPHSVDDRPWPS